MMDLLPLNLYRMETDGSKINITNSIHISLSLEKLKRLESSSGPTASATGGTAISDGNDRYNVFISSDTYTVSGGPVTAKVLVVAGGGGGGGYYYAGGGGAGGAIYAASLELDDGDYPVVVGGGGAGPTAAQTKGVNGVDSSFNGVTALGGGGGGSYSRSKTC